MRNRSAVIITSFSLILFVFSLFLPALGNYKGLTIFTGGILLLTFYGGLSGFFLGLFWLSNLGYFIGLVYILRTNYYKSIVWGLLAFFIGLAFILVSFLNLSFSKPALEGISTFRSGYWLWLLSMFLIPLFSGYLQRKYKNADETGSDPK